MALRIGWPAAVVAWASRLAFPRLLALTAALFVADLFLPDAIPFADEILLGLATAVLASRKRPSQPTPLDGEATGEAD